MKRTHFLLTALLVSTIALAACTSVPGGSLPQEATATVAPTATEEPAPTETSEATEVASHGGPVQDYVSLIDALRAGGATVEPAGEVEQEFFSPVGYVINVNGADVQVFEYPDAGAAEAEAALVSDDGGSIGTSMVTWVETPHFYKLERVLALYVGEDSAVTALLESVLGPQFAGR
jgi:hypothetical protein